jgi:hypothetical protein
MQKNSFLKCMLLLVCFNTLALIDNRFLPFYHTVYIRTFEKRSNLDFNFFMMFAHKSRLAGNAEGNLFELYGEYDLLKIADSLEAVGKTNPLKPEWQAAKEIPFDLVGKIDAQGVWFGGEINLRECLYIGARGAFLHLTSSQRFDFSEKIGNDLHLDSGGKIQLEIERREASNLLDIRSEQWTVNGMTDMDLYFRLGKIKEYTHKFKLIDYGLTLGVYAPTGTKRDIYNSASIPLGGDGFTGLYAMADVNLELMEDWWFGGWAQVVHRFSKTQKMRIPQDKEPQNYGAFVENVYVEPGLTLGISAYFRVLDFRKGLGGQAQYTLVNHFEDEFPFLTNRSVASSLEKKSEWLHEYFTVGLLYDMHHAIHCKNYDPYLYVNLDAPVYFVGSENVPKTFRVSLGIEVNF